MLARTAPEAQGIPSSAILDFVDAAEQKIDALHSLMLLRHGHTVAQGWWFPYRPEVPHVLFSVTKSFTSTAVGLAVAEGRLSVDDPVAPFFPEAMPAEAGPHLAALRVRHLLTMTTGQGADTVNRLFERADGDWVSGFFAQPIEQEPGTRFVYNSGASHILSAIVQRLTGLTLLDYLRPRLFTPLGIEDVTWETCPRGISAGGWGLNLRTGDVARFGELYLREGAWRGAQLVPREWVRAATALQVPSQNEEIDWRQGYGYQFWRCRHNAYRADGAFGQFCVVMPEQDAVLVVTSGTADTQSILDLVWEHLLPAMGPAPLPPDAAGRERLDHRLAHLSLPPVRGAASSPIAPQVSGRTYVAPDAPLIRTVALHFEPDGTRLVFGEHALSCGHGEWRLGSTTFNSDRPTAVAASGAWTDDSTYVLRVCAYETAFIRTFTFRFENDHLTVASSNNVSFGPTEHPTITARLQNPGEH